MMVWTLSIPCVKGQRRKAVLKGELREFILGHVEFEAPVVELQANSSRGLTAVQLVYCTLDMCQPVS